MRTEQEIQKKIESGTQGITWGYGGYYRGYLKALEWVLETHSSEQKEVSV